MNASCHPAAEPASASHPALERGSVTSAVLARGGSEIWREPPPSASEAHMWLQQWQHLIWVNSEQRRGCRWFEFGAASGFHQYASEPSGRARQRDMNKTHARNGGSRNQVFAFSSSHGLEERCGRTITGPHRPVERPSTRLEISYSSSFFH